MGSGRTGTGRARAIIAVVALYGLLLQGFLAGFAPPSHAASGQAICSPAGERANPDGGTPAHRGDTCCTLACAVAVPPLVLAPIAAPAWPPRAAAPIVWSAAETRVPTGPPVHSASARGPPAA